MKVASSLALLVAACGARTPLGTTVDAGPPAPPTCAAAVAAIDWSACEGVPGPDPRVLDTISCAHETATRGCESAAAAYWSCLAAQHGACVAYDAGVAGSIGTTVPAPACDGALAQMSDCLATCNAAYTCEGDGWTDCRCIGGVACGVYPASSSLPDCDVACSACD